MIISFYDKNFKALQDNSGLVIDKDSFSLIKRPTEMNDFSCTCEAFTENIQPTFIVVKDDKGSNSLIYASLAGIPLLNKNNQTEVNGTDIKSMLSSHVMLQQRTFANVNEFITYVFNEWNSQVMQGTINCELIFNDNVGNVPFADLAPTFEKVCDKYDAWGTINPYLKFYNLFIDTSIDLVAKKVVFIIGKTMMTPTNIKLWEHGIRSYGKWIADTNECQGYFLPQDSTDPKDLQAGTRWILTSQNYVTTDTSKRDIFPIKRKVVLSDKSLEDANVESLTTLLDSLYNENIEISSSTINPSFETKFCVYVKQGEEKYKDLPCGELHYDANGLIKFQIGYRYTGVKFI